METFYRNILLFINNENVDTTLTDIYAAMVDNDDFKEHPALPIIVQYQDKERLRVELRGTLVAMFTEIFGEHIEEVKEDYNEDMRSLHAGLSELSEYKPNSELSTVREIKGKISVNDTKAKLYAMRLNNYIDYSDKVGYIKHLKVLETALEIMNNNIDRINRLHSIHDVVINDTFGTEELSVIMSDITGSIEILAYADEGVSTLQAKNIGMIFERLEIMFMIFDRVMNDIHEVAVTNDLASNLTIPYDVARYDATMHLIKSNKTSVNNLRGVINEIVFARSNLVDAINGIF